MIIELGFQLLTQFVLVCVYQTAQLVNYKCKGFINLAPGDLERKSTITFIPLLICHTLTLKSQQYVGCLSHEPSLMFLAPTSEVSCSLVVERPY